MCYLCQYFFFRSNSKYVNTSSGYGGTHLNSFLKSQKICLFFIKKTTEILQHFTSFKNNTIMID
jgi:hypothetical protein